MKARILLLAFAAAGCELGEEVVLVETEDPKYEIAVAMFGDVVWTHNQDLSISAHDTADGEVLSTFGGEWTDGWDVIDLYKAYDNGFETDVWVLHMNGWRTRWAPDGTFTGFEQPMSDTEFPADSRHYYDVARDPWGVTYLTTRETVGSTSTCYLYKHVDGVYTRVDLGDGAARLDFDIATLQPAVFFLTYAPNTVSTLWFNKDTLALEYEVDAGDHLFNNDFRAFNHNTALCGSDLVLLDETGAVTDIDPQSCASVDVYYGDNSVWLWTAGGWPRALRYHELQ